MFAPVRKPARWALAWLGLVGLAALGAPWLAPQDPLAVRPAYSLRAPAPAHWLGTDVLGRDVFSRLVWGARRTGGMVALALLITAGLGTGLGLWAGYGGGAVDEWVMRGADVALAWPQLLVALVIVAGLGPSPAAVGGAVGLAGVAGFARLVRAAVGPIRGRVYVQAAQALGLSTRAILVRHILPNIAETLASVLSIHLAWAMLNTAALTFLGFGGNPALPDWGAMLNDGRAYLLAAPWVSAAPGGAITLSVLAAQVLARSWGTR